MRASEQFRMKRATAQILSALALLAITDAARAGAGWADNTDKAGVPFKQPTFYANSPMGVLAAHGPAGSIAPEGTTRDTGTALRKFVDNLPLVDGYVTNANLLKANAPGAPGRHIPTAVKEDVSSAIAAGKALAGAHSVSFPDADYYEIAVVEYREQLHSDLPPVKTSINPTTGGVITTGGTTLRGYVQIWTPNLPASTPKAQLWRLDGSPVLDNKGQPVFIVGDKPHYLGPIIDSTSGVPVRLKFDNYLPIGHYDPITKTRGGDVFIPTDTTVGGSGLGPLGAIDPNAPQPYELYTQNRTNIHLHGGDTPWISDGEPHDWITPAGENTPYKVGETTQNVPDMPDPGPGSQTLYYPNNQSARMMWYHDHSYGSTRIDVYAGIVSAFMIHDATEAAMKSPGGALAGMDEIPLIFEDKTFVPKDIAVEDSKWNTDAWGKYGDLWFPHVYESNQNPNSIDGTNPAGRWDYGPWFWPVFPAPLALPTGEYGNVSATQESFSDTPLINGIAYPNLNVEPKPYRFRLLNASLQRYLNVGFWIAEPLSVAVAANGLNYSTATTVAISADDNGNVPTATLQISPSAAPTVTMINGGKAYSASPTVVFTGGGASVQATGHAVVVGGVIQGVVVDTPGVGYTSDPSVSFVDATGSGASASVVANPGGQIMAIKLDPAPAGVTYSYTKTTPTFTLSDPGKLGTGASFNYSLNTEVPMVDAVMPAVNPAYGPDTYDGRPGGIPDPDKMGPNIIQIGTEGGFLAQPNVITPTPVSYTQLRRIVTVLNVQDHGLYVGPAERADFVVDFSQYAGKTLIFYNDCPAPNPGFDARVDYYTGDPDQTGAGGADVTQPGYGPNTRTIMRVNVAATLFNGSAAPPPYDPLNIGGQLASDLPKAFAASQDVPIVPESWQNAAYGTQYTDNTAHIYAGSYQQPTLTFNTGGLPQTLSGFRMDSAGAGYSVAPTVELTGGLDPVNGGTPATAHAVLDVAGKRIQSIVLDSPGAGYVNAPTVTLTGGDGIGASATAITSATQSVFVQPKGIQELFESSYGRMNATFSVELPFTSVLTQTTIPVGYIDPPTDQISEGETQFWKVTHNGVDTHVVHFHLFNVQVINRVAWDGTIVALDPAEYGWKETVKMNPLEDIYVAVRPKTPKQPFGVPQSIRALDPTQPIGATAGFSQVDPKTGLATTVTNQMYNFDWEYVWHCHILGHEENDFMRVIMFNFGTLPPAPVLNVTYNPSTQTVSWIDPTPAGVADTYTDKSNEQGFLVQRSDDGGRTWKPDLPSTTPQSAAQASMHPEGYLPNVTAANASSWTDPVPGTSQTSYRVLGFNSAGYSPTYVATVAGTGATGSTALTTPQSMGTPNAPTQLHGAVGNYDANTGGYPVTLTWAATPAPRNGYLITREGGFSAAGVAVPAVTFTVQGTPPRGRNPGTPAPTTFTDTTASEVSMYTYTVQSDNGNGNLSAGSLALVATPYAEPPVVTGVSNKVDPSGNAVTISWRMPPATTPDPTNITASPHVTAFNVVRTQTDANGAVISSTTFGVQQTINPLSGTITLPDTSYVDTQPLPGVSVYTIYAVNGDKTSTKVAPNNGSSTTVSLAATAAPGMQGATATANGPTQVTINWSPAPAGTSVTSYKITRTDGATTVTLPTGAGVATSFVDTTVAQNTTYTYTVQWLNGASVGTAQVTAPVTTPLANAVAVTGLTGTFRQTGNGANPTFSNTLSWTAGGPATSYVVSRCVGTAANGYCAAAGTVFTTLSSTVTATTFTDPNAQAGTVYVYQVQAMNGPNSVSAPVSTVVYDQFAPVAPTGVKNAIAAGSVTLSWTASATTSTTGYVVQRATDGVSFTTLNTVNGTSFVDKTVALGTTYTYRVLAQTALPGFPVVTGAASSTTVAIYGAPAAPVVSSTTPTFGGTAVAPTVSFQFAAPAANGAPPLTGYTVFRDGASYATLGSAAVAYTDTAPGVNATHSYQVFANNILGQSPASATVTAQTTVQAAPVASSAALGGFNGSQVTFNWTQTPIASAPPVTSYTLTVYTNGVAAAPVTVTNATRYTLQNASAGNSYGFTVTANNLIGASASSNTVSVVDGTPAAPTNPSAAISSGAVTLNWTASTSRSVTGYQVQRSVNGGAFTTVATPSTPGYVDSAVTIGSSYSYQIVAVAAPSGATAVNSTPASVAAAYVLPNAPVLSGPVTFGGTLTNPTVRFSWTEAAVANGVPVTGFLVFRDGAQLTGVAGTSYTDTTAGNAAHSYTVYAVNALGNSLVSNAIAAQASTQANPTLAAPTTARANGRSSVSVSWTETPNANAPTVTGYTIQAYQVNIFGQGVAVGGPVTQTATSYTLNNSNIGASYYFVVKTNDLYGASAGSQSSTIISR